MRPANVEITMGHDIGVSSSYYKPTEKEVLEDYLKAVSTLSISSDNVILQKEVAELQQRSKDNEYILKGRLQDTENEIKNIRTMLEKLLTSLSSGTDQQQFTMITKSLLASGLLKLS